MRVAKWVSSGVSSLVDVPTGGGAFCMALPPPPPHPQKQFGNFFGSETANIQQVCPVQTARKRTCQLGSKWPHNGPIRELPGICGKPLLPMLDINSKTIT